MTALIVVGLRFAPYPLSVPWALLTIITDRSWLVPLNADATKMVGRRRIAGRELTAYLAKRGWTHKETIADPSCSLACNEEFIFEKGGVRLTAFGLFRKGFWWYDLNRAP